jgi:hypothetical protein
MAFCKAKTANQGGSESYEMAIHQPIQAHINAQFQKATGIN